MFGVENLFLNMSQNSEVIKEKTNKLDSIEIKINFARQ